MIDIEKMRRIAENTCTAADCDKCEYNDSKDKRDIVLEIHSGKNRIIRRIFEHLNYYVELLDRISFAGLTKRSLARGEWRFLSNEEIQNLKTKNFNL